MKDLQLASQLMVKDQLVSLKMKNKIRMFIFTTPIQHHAGGTGQCNKA